MVYGTLRYLSCLKVFIKILKYLKFDKQSLSLNEPNVWLL